MAAKQKSKRDTAPKTPAVNNRSSSGKRARRHGAEFERETAKLLKEYGFDDAHRTQQYCGNSGEAADVVGLPGIHIECKFRQNIAGVFDWLEQAQNDCKGKTLPVVIAGRAREKMPFVAMRFDVFMQLYKMAFSGVENDRGV